MEQSKHFITDIKFDKKGEHLLSSSSDGKLNLFSFTEFESRLINSSGDPRPNQPVFASLDTGQNVSCVEWNPENQYQILSSFSTQPEVHVYDLKEGGQTPVRTFRDRYAGSFLDFKIFKGETSQFNGTTIFTSSRDGKLRFGKMNDRELRTVTEGSASGHINCLEVSNDAQLVFASHSSGVISVWDIRNAAKIVTEIKLKEQLAPNSSYFHATSLKLHPSGSKLAFTTSDFRSGLVDILDERMKIVSITHSKNKEPPLHFAKTCFSSDGNYFGSVSTKTGFSLIEFNEQVRTNIFVPEPFCADFAMSQTVTCLSFHPFRDTHYVFAGTTCNSISTFAPTKEEKQKK